MKIQYYISRYLTVAFFTVSALFSGESLAGLIVDSVNSRFAASGSLIYDPNPDDGSIFGQSISTYSGDDEVSSTDLSTQAVELSFFEEVNNFAAAPPASEQFVLAHSVSTTASDNESEGVRRFQSTVELDYGPVEAPDNPDYQMPDASDDEGMFAISGRHSAAVQFNFSIDTPHEYSFSYAVGRDDNNQILGPLITFRGEEYIVLDNIFAPAAVEISGLLQPGNYSIVNDVIGNISMEFGVPTDFGSAPVTSSFTLSLRDLDNPDTGDSVPVPGSAWLLISGIGLLRLRHRQGI